MRLLRGDIAVGIGLVCAVASVARIRRNVCVLVILA
jgi:hypothetical protein